MEKFKHNNCWDVNVRWSQRAKAMCAVLIIFPLLSYAQPAELDSHNIVWETQSENSGESMPCGGGDIGLNVWTENNEVLFYLSRSGAFDENNALLKLGRVRINIEPNPFINGTFKQVLSLKDGNVLISAKNNLLEAHIVIWVDVFKPVIHADVQTSIRSKVTASYESWRYRDRSVEGRANNANSFKWTAKNVVTKKDVIEFKEDQILFYHRNSDSTMFDITVDQQGMTSLKDQMWNPLKHRTFGGCMQGEGFVADGTRDGTYIDTDYKSFQLTSAKPKKNHSIEISLHTGQASTIGQWLDGLQRVIDTRTSSIRKERASSVEWWHRFWNRSYIFIKSEKKDSVWQASRNYQLFRYMLGCNAYGSSPTKFNGGLFTYDPSLIDTSYRFTPDHRNWGGGTHTAQNQRLVYFPMLKSGDFDMMTTQFDFYLKALRNAELRSEFYWNHNGACFTEQIENFGLPNYAEYGTKRPEWYDKGLEYNAWLEYQWDTVLEFCLMILECETYGGKNIEKYIPLIESVLTFFNEHYQYRAAQRGRNTFDQNGDLIFYPGSACETYKMAYNPSSTTSALRVVLQWLLRSEFLPEGNRQKWQTMLDRIPPLEFREFEGNPAISPAKIWERINNTEAPQLYPVYPWGEFGIGKAGLDTAINTYMLDSDVQKFKTHVGWKQYGIWAARLGLTEEAANMNTLKLKDSGRRFPAFWGPGFDWVPDHNWGGSGMIGLQEMLLQANGDQLLLFPAWPKDWDVHFKLHAPDETTVEAKLVKGRLQSLIVSPESRKKDVINLLQANN